MHYITGLYYVYILHDKLPHLQVQIYANSFVSPQFPVSD